MRMYRIVTVHRVVQTIERVYRIKVASMAQAAKQLADGDLPDSNMCIEHTEEALPVEAHITDVTGQGESEE